MNQKTHSSFDRVPAGTLRINDVGREISLAGWVQKHRDFGELVFIDLRDRSGICQVVVDKARGADEALLAAAKEARSEFVVRIDGGVIAPVAGPQPRAIYVGGAWNIGRMWKSDER